MSPSTFPRKLKDGNVHYVTVGDYEATCTYPNADSSGTLCMRIFTKVHLMRDHLIECHAEGMVQRPYRCDTCHKGFRLKKQLGQCQCKKGANQSQPQAGPSCSAPYSGITEEQLRILRGVLESLRTLVEYPGQSTVDSAVGEIQRANILLGDVTGTPTPSQSLVPAATSPQWEPPQNPLGLANTTGPPQLPPPPPPQFISIQPSNVPAPPAPFRGPHSPGYITDPHVLEHPWQDQVMPHPPWQRTPVHPQSPASPLPPYGYHYPPMNASTAEEEGSRGFDPFFGSGPRPCTGGGRNANTHPSPPM